LEKRINELESTAKSNSNGGGDIQVGGLVENVVGQFIPGLGGIIKALEASSPEFRQRIADTDAEIKHRIDVGWSSKPVVDYHVSTRPMRRGVGKPTARTDSVRMPEAPFREPIVDVLDGNGCMTVIAELPGVSEDELDVKLGESNLEITAGRFSKKISLPRAVKEIVDKSYKNGILQIKLN
jgi:HSP20 family protein